MNTSSPMTGEEWNDEVIAVLGDTLRRAGMGEPAGSSPFYVMWHAGAGSQPKPCQDSIVWEKSGSACYDVTVRLDQVGDGRERLVVFTEGSELLDMEPPSSLEELSNALRPMTAAIPQAVEKDFATFERDNDGYLPGAEPRD